MNSKITDHALHLCHEIEKLDASVQQTRVSSMASDLRAVLCRILAEEQVEHPPIEISELTDRNITKPYKDLLRQIEHRQARVIGIKGGLDRIDKGMTEECYIYATEELDFGCMSPIPASLARPFFEQALEKEMADIKELVARFSSVPIADVGAPIKG